jgi:hypothetical protein
VPRTLRLAQLIVQPVLVWDDGELSPGPDLPQIGLPLSRLGEFAAGLPAEIAALQAKLETGP